jgi:hypothetical protein
VDINGGLGFPDVVYVTPDDLIANAALGPEDITYDRSPAGGTVGVYSPAHILLTDPSGRRTGQAPNGHQYHEIPGSAWRRTPYNESVSAEGLAPNWKVTLTGYASGKYHLRWHSIDLASQTTVEIPGETHRGKVTTYFLHDLPFQASKRLIRVGVDRRLKLPIYATPSGAGQLAISGIARGKPLTPASQQFRVSPGGKATVTMRLSKAAFGWLQQASARRVRVTITMRGAPFPITSVITLRAVQKRKIARR